ncbi:MAG: type II toxin-antitoxin system prevent-host-death family antitoxin [Micrococcales bacterium]|nr:type II toxin-antitoxin system prevent-host-death family antitoxin [Micrococcales bacterium]
MTEVGVLEARNGLSSLIKRVRAGEQIVITLRGEPQVRLVAVQPEPEQGSAAAVLALLAEIEPSGHSLAETEASINAERASWA